jgi:hypothetical protein
MMKTIVGLALGFGFIAAILCAQDLPEGEGKKTLEKVCTSCHDLGVVTSQRNTKETWQMIVDGMVQSGATASSDEITTIVDYLAKNFGPEAK